MAGRQSILIIDDEPNMIWLFQESLNHRYSILGALDGAAGLKIIATQPVDLVMLDLRLPDMDGIQVLREMRKQHGHLPVIMMTAYATVQNAVEAMKAGAYDYVVKPFDFHQVEQAIRAALTMQRVKAGGRPAEATGSEEAIIAESRTMQEVLATVRQVADTTATVLIQGESGTGKEVIVRALHRWSPRREGPFLPINCAALPEHLLEAELFGYEAGAFTGATRAKPGKFELASGGTLFLDEIGDTPLELQGKLLRVMEEKQVERLGGTKSIKVDVRLVAASNRDLVDLARRGLFREDLYYRLAVIPVYLPPLRERREDILPLADHFLEVFARRYGRDKVVLSEEVRGLLQSYAWLGNVRELRNLMERLSVLRAGARLRPEDLPEPLVRADPALDAGRLKETIDYTRQRLEQDLFRDALERCGGNRTKAAEYLGVSRRWLQKRLKYYNLQ